MTVFVINGADDTAKLTAFMAGMKLPYTVSIHQGRDRSLDQNRLAFMLYKEIAQHFGDRTPEDVRAECKLTIGTPLLRSENEKFRDVYDRLIKGLLYHEKLELMTEPMDLPITRIMTTRQMADYLDQIYRRYSEQGCVLTSPESERP